MWRGVRSSSSEAGSVYMDLEQVIHSQLLGAIDDGRLEHWRVV